MIFIGISAVLLAIVSRLATDNRRLRRESERKDALMSRAAAANERAIEAMEIAAAREWSGRST